jgi:hypothetical protein
LLVSIAATEVVSGVSWAVGAATGEGEELEIRRESGGWGECL